MTLKTAAYHITGTISKSEFFLTIITNIEELIGITKATMLPKRVPENIESPIINMPDIAKIIEVSPTKKLFLLDKNNNIVETLFKY